MPREHLRLDAEKGEYYDVLFDSPAIIMDLFVYRAWHEKLYKVFETGASTILFEIGKELGIHGFQKLKKKSEESFKIGFDWYETWVFIGLGKNEYKQSPTLKNGDAKIDDHQN